MGGDFFDIFALPSRQGAFGLVIGDVTGKGVPAALYMGMCKTAIHAAAGAGGSPTEILQAANTAIIEEGEAALLLSAFYAEWEPARGTLVWANAGHDPPLWLAANDPSPRSLRATGMLLGVERSLAIEGHKLSLAPGDRLLLYTDGAVDAFAPGGDRYGRQRLQSVLVAHRSLATEALLAALVKDIDAFTQGEAQADDLTFLLLQRDSATQAI